MMAYWRVDTLEIWIALIVFVLHQIGSLALQFSLVPAVANVHVPNNNIKLDTIKINGSKNCMVECFMEPDCVSAGYSGGYSACQLYSTDVTGFMYGLVAQEGTIFYKAVCDRTDYTFVRPLSICMKRHVSAKTLDDANMTCTAEGAGLLTLRDDTMRQYLMTTFLYIHNTPFQYILDGGYLASEWQWQDGTDIDENNGANFWGTAEPEIANGTCVSMGSSTGNSLVLAAANCSTAYMFICTT